MYEAISAANEALLAISTTAGQQRPELTVSDIQGFQFKLMLQGQPVPAALAPRKADVPQSKWPRHHRLTSGQRGEEQLQIWLDPGFCVDGFLALCEQLRSEAVTRLTILGAYEYSLDTMTWLDLWEVLAYCWPNLEALAVGDYGMPAAAVEALGQMAAAGKWARLKQLRLFSLKLGDAGVTALVQGGATHWQQLQELDLRSNGIGPDGVKALTDVVGQSTSWQQLRVLVLTENPLGDAGVSALASGAPQWPDLEKLDLDMTDIGSAGACAVARAAQYWTNLKELNVGGNPKVQVDDILALCEATPPQCCVNYWYHEKEEYIPDRKADWTDSPWSQNASGDWGNMRCASLLESVLQMLHELPCSMVADCQPCNKPRRQAQQFY